MNIEKIHIYGFGKFIDCSINIQHTFHIIQGENEAGKSTLRAFIAAVLFGFPSKKEKRLRYEPKKSSAYGGSLTLRLQSEKVIIIERVMRTKAAGDVAVYLENGEVLGEEWLLSFLGNMDRTVFQGIFCFGLEGLSEIDQLKGDALNRYIYEAGMTGTKRVFQMDKEIESELSALFKPKGKKPVINKSIKDLNSQLMELRKWEREFDRYSMLLKQKKQFKQELDALQAEKKQLMNEKENLQRKETLLHSVQEKIELDRKMKVLEPFDKVALEAEEQWKHYSNERTEAEKGIEESKIRIQQLSSKHTGAFVDWTIIKAIDKIHALKEKVPLYKKYVKDKESLGLSIQKKKEKAADRLERLGILDAGQLDSSVTTILAEKELHQIIEKGKELKERQRLLEEQHIEQQRKLDLLKTDLSELEQQRRPVSECKNSERIVCDQEFLEKGFRRAGNTTEVILQIAAVIFLTLGCWEILTGSLFLGGAVFAIGTAAFVFLFYRKQSQKNSFEAFDNLNYSEHKRLLEQDQRTEAAVREMKWQFDREENMYQSFVDRLKEAAVKWNGLENELQKWCSRYQFPFINSIHIAESFFQAVREWKDLNEEISAMKKEQKVISKELEEIKTEVNDIAKPIDFPLDNTLEHIVMGLWERYKREEQENNIYLKEAEKIDAAFQQKQFWITMRTNAVIFIDKIYKTAEADNQDAFFHAISQKKQYVEWKKQKQWLEQQIAGQLLPEETIENWVKELHSPFTQPEEKKELLNDDLVSLEQREQDLFQTIAEVTQDIKRIEEGGTYEEKLQQFGEEKESLQKKIHKWLVLKTSKQLIEQAKAVYEKERQPQVIQKASSYFSYITREKYERLYAPAGQEKFIVEDSSGLRFSPEELSRGTAEQLYLCLRFALAEAYSQAEVFPLIMDDPFVNFDQVRQQSAFSLLHKAAANRQVIYFTCQIPSSSVISECAVTKLSSS
ncbi:AAA family ATPase [Alteribacillus sp. YIM 98480]|uniref:ATP-binding protein n=1 Tax=Alteribacillus sp. YIM 98480 TaxID=2606599 RepID=UPI00131DAC2E|nr:AAA family ATPase [Alteribacillus sp. YIM 98480]